MVKTPKIMGILNVTKIAFMMEEYFDKYSKAIKKLMN